jgi:hypothetical protein
MCPPSASYLPFPTAGIFTAARNGRIGEVFGDLLYEIVA